MTLLRECLAAALLLVLVAWESRWPLIALFLACVVALSLSSLGGCAAPSPTVPDIRAPRPVPTHVVIPDPLIVRHPQELGPCA